MDPNKQRKQARIIASVMAGLMIFSIVASAVSVFL